MNAFTGQPYFCVVIVSFESPQMSMLYVSQVQVWVHVSKAHSSHQAQFDREHIVKMHETPDTT